MDGHQTHQSNRQVSYMQPAQKLLVFYLFQKLQTFHSSLCEKFIEGTHRYM